MNFSITITKNSTLFTSLTFPIYKTTALIGPSGSGKTLTLKALLHLLPSEFQATLKTPFPLQRGSTVGFVPQNPFNALNGYLTLRQQFFSTQATDYMYRVGLDPLLLDRYPRQLSGGQLQRSVIAMVLSQHPQLLLLDEPTTALDKESKKNLLSLFNTLQETEKFKILIVSHDISALQNFADYSVIINKGRIIEQNTTHELFAHPRHHFTKQLLQSDFTYREFRQ